MNEQSRSAEQGSNKSSLRDRIVEALLAKNPDFDKATIEGQVDAFIARVEQQSATEAQAESSSTEKEPLAQLEQLKIQALEIFKQQMSHGGFWPAFEAYRQKLLTSPQPNQIDLDLAVQLESMREQFSTEDESLLKETSPAIDEINTDVEEIIQALNQTINQQIQTLETVDPTSRADFLAKVNDSIGKLTDQIFKDLPFDQLRTEVAQTLASKFSENSINNQLTMSGLEKSLTEKISPEQLADLQAVLKNVLIVMNADVSHQGRNSSAVHNQLVDALQHFFTDKEIEVLARNNDQPVKLAETLKLVVADLDENSVTKYFQLVSQLPKMYRSLLADFLKTKLQETRDYGYYAALKLCHPQEAQEDELAEFDNNSEFRQRLEINQVELKVEAVKQTENLLAQKLFKENYEPLNNFITELTKNSQDLKELYPSAFFPLIKNLLVETYGQQLITQLIPAQAKLGQPAPRFEDFMDRHRTVQDLIKKVSPNKAYTRNSSNFGKLETSWEYNEENATDIEKKVAFLFSFIELWLTKTENGAYSQINLMQQALRKAEELGVLDEAIKLHNSLALTMKEITNSWKQLKPEHNLPDGLIADGITAWHRHQSNPDALINKGYSYAGENITDDIFASMSFSGSNREGTPSRSVILLSKDGSAIPTAEKDKATAAAAKVMAVLREVNELAEPIKLSNELNELDRGNNNLQDLIQQSTTINQKEAGELKQKFDQLFSQLEQPDNPVFNVSETVGELIDLLETGKVYKMSGVEQSVREWFDAGLETGLLKTDKNQAFQVEQNNLVDEISKQFPSFDEKEIAAFVSQLKPPKKAEFVASSQAQLKNWILEKLSDQVNRKINVIINRSKSLPKIDALAQQILDQTLPGLNLENTNLDVFKHFELYQVVNLGRILWENHRQLVAQPLSEFVNSNLDRVLISQNQKEKLLEIQTALSGLYPQYSNELDKLLVKEIQQQVLEAKKAKLAELKSVEIETPILNESDQLKEAVSSQLKKS